MTFIDASAYLSFLIPTDRNHDKAPHLISRIEDDTMTSYAILGEVLTVGSLRYNRQAAVDFVSDILKGKTTVVMENEELIALAFNVFGKIKDKDVSWVDCYSFAIIEKYQIETIFSFDRDFKTYTKAKVLG